MQYSRRYQDKVNSSFQSPSKNTTATKNSNSNGKNGLSASSNKLFSPRSKESWEGSPDRSQSPHAPKLFNPETLEQLKRKREDLKAEAKKNEKVIFLPKEKRIKNVIKHESELTPGAHTLGKESSFEVIGPQKYMDIADEKELKMYVGGLHENHIKVIEERPSTKKNYRSGEKYIRERIVDTIGFEVVQRPGLALTPIEKKHEYEFKTKEAMEMFTKDQNKCKVDRRNEYANRNKSRVRKVKKSEIDRLRERGTILARELNNDQEMSAEGRDERVRALLEINRKYKEALEMNDTGEGEPEDSGSIYDNQDPSMSDGSYGGKYAKRKNKGTKNGHDLDESDKGGAGRGRGRGSREKGSRGSIGSMGKGAYDSEEDEETEPHFGYSGISNELGPNDKATLEPEKSSTRKRVFFEDDLERAVRQRMKEQGKRYRDEIFRLKAEISKHKKEYDPDSHSREVLGFRESELRAVRFIQYEYRQYKKRKAKISKRGVQTDDGSMKSYKKIRPKLFSRPFKITSLLRGKEKSHKGYFETAVHFSFMSQIHQMDPTLL